MSLTLSLKLKPTTNNAGFFYIDKSLIKLDILKLNKKYRLIIMEEENES